jgi:hypothetical protein
VVAGALDLAVVGVDRVAVDVEADRRPALVAVDDRGRERIGGGGGRGGDQRDRRGQERRADHPNTRIEEIAMSPGPASGSSRSDVTLPPWDGNGTR